MQNHKNDFWLGPLIILKMKFMERVFFRAHKNCTIEHKQEIQRFLDIFCIRKEPPSNLVVFCSVHGPFSVCCSQGKFISCHKHERNNTHGNQQMVFVEDKTGMRRLLQNFFGWKFSADPLCHFQIWFAFLGWQSQRNSFFRFGKKEHFKVILIPVILFKENNFTQAQWSHKWLRGYAGWSVFKSCSSMQSLPWVERTFQDGNASYSGLATKVLNTLAEYINFE